MHQQDQAMHGIWVLQTAGCAVRRACRPQPTALRQTEFHGGSAWFLLAQLGPGAGGGARRRAVARRRRGLRQVRPRPSVGLRRRHLAAWRRRQACSRGRPGPCRWRCTCACHVRCFLQSFIHTGLRPCHTWFPSTPVSTVALYRRLRASLEWVLAVWGSRPYLLA